MRSILLVFLTISLLTLQTSYASDSSLHRPKLGLALSGGGAKGLVYVPLLKALDSLEIKIDYLTGTSMGGIVGGLYAIGYTGKELEEMALSMDWNTVIRDKLPLSKVNMEEKDEYGKYLLELKGNTAKPSLPKGVIDGQNILTFLNSMIADFLYINDFSQFKIPFKCYAADLVEGVPVELSSGSLTLALKATMSIPTVFAPIDTSGMLLVDGGVLKNFPVEEVQKMGADFIIGANCSGSDMYKDEMNTLFKVFERMININASENYDKQKDLCDILIDFSEALKYLNIGAADFNRAAEIIELGNNVISNFMPLLEELALQQKKFLPELPASYVNWKETHTQKLDHVPTAVFDNEFKPIIYNKIEFEDPTSATNYEVNRAIDRIYGTRFFDQVYYYYDHEIDSIPVLMYKTEGANKFNYKLGVHYDPELSAGLMLNLTYRKLGKRSSRTMVTVDLSENPKLRTGYQVYFGNSSWWFSTEQSFTSIKQISYAKDGALGTYKNYYTHANMAVNWTIGQNNLISLGPEFEFMSRRAFTSVKDRAYLPVNASILSHAPYYNLNVFLLLKRNTLNKKAYPTKGIHVHGLLKVVPHGGGHWDYDVISQEDGKWSRVRKQDKDDFSAYSKLHLQYEQYIPLHKIFTLQYKWDLGMMFISHGLKGRNFDFPSQDAFLMGGIDLREKERVHNYIPFWGNREGYLHAYNFTSLSISAQVEVVKNLFVVPKFNALLYDNVNRDGYGEDKLYIHNLKDYMKWAWSGGVELGYESPLGPIKINLSQASNFSRPIFYASLGYRF